MHTKTIRLSMQMMLALAALFTAAAVMATPVTIDFDTGCSEARPPEAPAAPACLPTFFGLETWQEDGMSLTSNVPSGTLVDNNNLVRANLFTPGTGNNTQSLFFGANGEVSTVSMSHDNGFVFDLLSFDASSLYNAAGELTVTGYLAGGGTVSQLLTLNSSLSNYALSGFDGLSSVDFSFDGAVYAAPYDLDNVNINVVPVPAAVWLFGSALMALWSRKRFTRA